MHACGSCSRACMQVEHMRVDIETASVLSPGQTVCDIWRQSGKTPNVYVATQINVAVFWQLMLNAIALADQVSPLNQPNAASH